MQNQVECCIGKKQGSNKIHDAAFRPGCFRYQKKYSDSGGIGYYLCYDFVFHFLVLSA